MIIPKLAIRNLLGAGIRTWLNVIVLSFSFVAIIWTQGLYVGMNEQATHARVEAEIGGGQFWQEHYDPFDPMTLNEAHDRIPALLSNLIQTDRATAILVTQGTIYPQGRIQSILLKGIDPQQKILNLPTSLLNSSDQELPALIGKRTARTTGLKIGDYVTVRWRDVNGTFDAREAKIVQIMNTSVSTVDNGQIWLPLKKLQHLTGAENEATMIVVEKNFSQLPLIPGWEFKNQDFLLKDLHDMVRMKSVGAFIMYIILLFLAMLAIFDTQVLSLFRRRKEMGTLMALGMTRVKIIQLFTVEGAAHSVLAALVAAIYGIPLLTYSAVHGWALPQAMDDYGFSIGEKLFPRYSLMLVLGTTLSVIIVTTIVSFLPSRKIAKLKPTDALRGKLS